MGYKGPLGHCTIQCSGTYLRPFLAGDCGLSQYASSHDYWQISIYPDNLESEDAVVQIISCCGSELVGGDVDGGGGIVRHDHNVTGPNPRSDWRFIPPPDYNCNGVPLFHIQSASTNKYVGVTRGAICLCDDPTRWTVQIIADPSTIPNPPFPPSIISNYKGTAQKKVQSSFCLRDEKGQFLRVNASGEVTLSTYASAWDEFYLDKSPTGMMNIRTSHHTYLSSKNEGQICAVSRISEGRVPSPSSPPSSPSSSSSPQLYHSTEEWWVEPHTQLTNRVQIRCKTTDGSYKLLSGTSNYEQDDYDPDNTGYGYEMDITNPIVLLDKVGSSWEMLIDMPVLPVDIPPTGTTLSFRSTVGTYLRGWSDRTTSCSGYLSTWDEWVIKKGHDNMATLQSSAHGTYLSVPKDSCDVSLLTEESYKINSVSCRLTISPHSTKRGKYQISGPGRRLVGLGSQYKIVSRVKEEATAAWEIGVGLPRIQPHIPEYMYITSRFRSYLHHTGNDGDIVKCTMDAALGQMWMCAHRPEDGGLATLTTHKGHYLSMIKKRLDENPEMERFMQTQEEYGEFTDGDDVVTGWKLVALEKGTEDVANACRWCVAPHPTVPRRFAIKSYRATESGDRQSLQCGANGLDVDLVEEWLDAEPWEFRAATRTSQSVDLPSAGAVVLSIEPSKCLAHSPSGELLLLPQHEASHTAHNTHWLALRQPDGSVIFQSSTSTSPFVILQLSVSDDTSPKVNLLQKKKSDIRVGGCEKWLVARHPCNPSRLLIESCHNHMYLVGGGSGGGNGVQLSHYCYESDCWDVRSVLMRKGLPVGRVILRSIHGSILTKSKNGSVKALPSSVVEKAVVVTSTSNKKKRSSHDAHVWDIETMGGDGNAIGLRNVAKEEVGGGGGGGYLSVSPDGALTIVPHAGDSEMWAVSPHPIEPGAFSLQSIASQSYLWCGDDAKTVFQTTKVDRWAAWSVEVRGDSSTSSTTNNGPIGNITLQIPMTKNFLRCGRNKQIGFEQRLSGVVRWEVEGIAGGAGAVYIRSHTGTYMSATDASPVVLGDALATIPKGHDIWRIERHPTSRGRFLLRSSATGGCLRCTEDGETLEMCSGGGGDGDFWEVVTRGEVDDEELASGAFKGELSFRSPYSTYLSRSSIGVCCGDISANLSTWMVFPEEEDASDATGAQYTLLLLYDSSTLYINTSPALKATELADAAEQFRIVPHPTIRGMFVIRTHLATYISYSPDGERVTQSSYIGPTSSWIVTTDEIVEQSEQHRPANQPISANNNNSSALLPKGEQAMPDTTTTLTPGDDAGCSCVLQ